MIWHENTRSAIFLIIFSWFAVKSQGREPQPQLIRSKPVVLVRSAKRSICCSLMRFSMSPVRSKTSHTKRLLRIEPLGPDWPTHLWVGPSRQSADCHLEIKSPLCQITRRALVQLSRVEYSTRRNSERESLLCPP
jgi:hypothetical protein